MSIRPWLMESQPSIKRLYDDNWNIISAAPGSSGNHQAWAGGYLDHVEECLEIAYHSYASLSREIRLLPFDLQDALDVLLLHDIEKPWRFCGDGDDQWLSQHESELFRHKLLDRYSIKLSDEQANALEYVHGEPDHEHSKDRRVAGRMAAFVHACDYLSARMWFDEPRRG